MRFLEFQVIRFKYRASQNKQPILVNSNNSVSVQNCDLLRILSGGIHCRNVLRQYFGRNIVHDYRDRTHPIFHKFAYYSKSINFHDTGLAPNVQTRHSA